MRTRPIRVAAALLALGAAWLLSPASLALSVKPINVADMVRQSDQIVAGTVTEVSQGTDGAGLPFTQIRVKVAESIRGAAAGTLTFRQFGLQDPRPAADGRKFVGLVAGMPRYEKGEQVVLFLSRASAIGFRSTVGLEQGRFVLRGGNFENGIDNAGLFHGVDFSNIALDVKEKSLVATQQGSLDAATFLGVVRRAVNGSWWTNPVIAPPLTGRPRQIGTKKAQPGLATGVVR